MAEPLSLISDAQSGPRTLERISMRGDLREAAEECRHLLVESVHRNMGDSLLLSGGLDTSIIAHLAAEEARPKCYTVAFTYARAPDLFYAKAIATKLKLEWELVTLPTEQLHERLMDIVRILKTFDPMEVRNSVAVYHGLKAAETEGRSKVMTGDAADELFAGYSFTFNLEPKLMMRRLRELWEVMHFSSRPMAAALGMIASLPYLDEPVIMFARTLKPNQLVGTRNGKKYGKLVLRLAFERTIGKRSAWRVKTPIEYGSGTTSLPDYYSKKVSDGVFNAEKERIAERDGVKIRDKEHLEYYRLFRTAFPPPREMAKSQGRCPDCGADVKPKTSFCVTCGAYPIAPQAV